MIDDDVINIVFTFNCSRLNSSCTTANSLMILNVFVGHVSGMSLSLVGSTCKHCCFWVYLPINSLEHILKYKEQVGLLMTVFFKICHYFKINQYHHNLGLYVQKIVHTWESSSVFPLESDCALSLQNTLGSVSGLFWQNAKYSCFRVKVLIYDNLLWVMEL